MVCVCVCVCNSGESLQADPYSQCQEEPGSEEKGGWKVRATRGEAGCVVMPTFM